MRTSEQPPTTLPHTGQDTPTAEDLRQRTEQLVQDVDAHLAHLGQQKQEMAK